MMKSIKDYIIENLIFESKIEKFSKATVKEIRNNILDSYVEFNIKDTQITDCEFYQKSNYIHFKYKCKTPRNNFYSDDLIHIYSNSIEIADIKLSNIKSYESRCELVAYNYDSKTNKTCLEYKVDGLKVNDGFDYLYGDIKLYIPNDIINASEIYDLDCKSYDKFMEEYLLKKAEYHNTKINREDIIGWESKIEKNELYIYLQLETGKGYSTNYREETYNFIWNKSYYNCDKNLNDKDYEAQIIRKFISGLQEFIKTKSELPEKVHIIVSQELE